jgi:hypothetical protein
MGVPKCFGHLGCLEVTLVLKDFKTVTGRIIGGLDDDRKKYDNCGKPDGYGKHEEYDPCDHKKDDKYDHKKDDKHDEPKCCEPPKVDVIVDVDEKCDFILLELTREASSVSLGAVLLVDGTLTVDWTSVVFSVGSCIAVNVCDIIYAGVNATITDDSFTIGI